MDSPGELWLFTDEEVEGSPSRLAGMSVEDEREAMEEMALYLFRCSRALRVPMLTGAVAIKFWQRVFMLESMKKLDRWDVAKACFFLACKTQETRATLGLVINVCVKEKTRGSVDFPEGEDVREGTERFFEEKEWILAAEREILRILNFDLYVPQPYTYATQLVRSFVREPAKQNMLLQAAYVFLNDSFRTYLHLQYDEKEIASTVVYLASRYVAVELSDGTQRDARGNRIIAWHELYRCDIDHVNRIGTIMLDLYEAQYVTKTQARDDTREET
mmetsp:Transcript_15856/g.31821  ORF Transcript_15856/g.31821 Transcript_15856/m.31821 type:complete len:274 (-) Transcript_15856:404-1225(-)|eukprot:CAMPEP_0184681702 /NCGR_PEP_ID=MMETSP0312-20130426/4685_1 /TAXON_ID=31354 /ORGANISM="Compsopogon coeruleus, Strain SAG 36.94" /LENGTH=273 /DNA_ID=CAMNT_0027132703 /DNA_START=163 /DNA_END=984 /DNA_ORIENTATION=+